jgi:hypothetical protein
MAFSAETDCTPVVQKDERRDTAPRPVHELLLLQRDEDAEAAARIQNDEAIDDLRRHRREEVIRTGAREDEERHRRDEAK